MFYLTCFGCTGTLGTSACRVTHPPQPNSTLALHTRRCHCPKDIVLFLDAILVYSHVRHLSSLRPWGVSWLSNTWSNSDKWTQVYTYVIAAPRPKLICVICLKSPLTPLKKNPAQIIKYTGLDYYHRSLVSPLRAQRRLSVAFPNGRMWYGMCAE